MGISQVPDSFLRLSVWHPVFNRQFASPVFGIRLPVASTSSDGGTGTVTVTLSGTVDLRSLMPTMTFTDMTIQKIAVLENASGQKEEHEIVGCYGGSPLSLKVVGLLSYTSPTYITILSTTWPEGWACSSSTGYGLLYDRLIGSGYSGSGLKIASTNTSSVSLSQTLNEFVRNITYRASLFYRLNASISPAVTIAFKTGSYAVRTLSLDETTGNQWLRVDTDFTPLTSSMTSSVVITKSGSIDLASPLYISDLVIGHAFGTSAGLPYFEMDCHPTRISTSYSNIDKPVGRVSGWDATRKEFRGRIRKRAVNLSYESVSETMVNDLFVLLDWQDRGNMIVFELPYYELRPYMVGYLSVSFRRNSRNLSYYDVDLTFVET